MSDPTPPGISLLAFSASVVGAFIIGGLVDLTFHEVADLRPYVPPIFSSKLSATLACDDIDWFVRHAKDLGDHHVRADTFGIHRQKTIDAVNELYDRARCDAHQDDYGHETYKTLATKLVVDSNDAPAPAASVAAAPALTAPAVDPAAPRTVLYGTIRSRRRVVIVNDGTLDAAPATPPAPKPQCGPDPVSGINWHFAGCP